jgi:hypothetical protein
VNTEKNTGHLQAILEGCAAQLEVISRCVSPISGNVDDGEIAVKELLPAVIQILEASKKMRW